jgi:gliding motility-associated-like protein
MNFNGIAISESTENTFHIPEGEEAEGIYQVMIYSSESCFISPPYTYEINGFPVAGLESEAILCQDEILLLGEKNIGTFYIWNTGETSQTIAISEPGVYAVTVSNACGNSVAESTIYDDGAISSCTYVVPNAFSPDGDGHNDVFRALTECCLTKYSLQVFSRWGNLVFQSDDVSNGWNGTYKGAPLPTDVYIWKASWRVTLDGREKTFSKAGDVLLLR